MPRPTKNAIRYVDYLKKRNPEGRPTKMTETVLAKLEDTFINPFTQRMSKRILITVPTKPPTIQPRTGRYERKRLERLQPMLTIRSTSDCLT